jgi:hypothetical protein
VPGCPLRSGGTLGQLVPTFERQLLARVPPVGGRALCEAIRGYLGSLTDSFVPPVWAFGTDALRPGGDGGLGSWRLLRLLIFLTPRAWEVDPELRDELKRSECPFVRSLAIELPDYRPEKLTAYLGEGIGRGDDEETDDEARGFDWFVGEEEVPADWEPPEMEPAALLDDEGASGKADDGGSAPVRPVRTFRSRATRVLAVVLLAVLLGLLIAALIPVIRRIWF